MFSGDFRPSVELLLVAGMVGFGVYCVTCAVHVWSKRNRRARGGTGTRAALRRLGTLLLLAGGVTTAAAVALALAVDRQGVLDGEELLSVRVPEELRVRDVVEAESVAAGDVLVRFADPEREAEVDVLRLRLAELAAKRDATLGEPLAPNPEIARRLQETQAQRRHLETQRHELAMERGRLLREQFRERIARTSDVHDLATALDSTRDELRQAESELELQRARFERNERLHSRQALSDDQLQQERSALAVRQAEVDRLGDRLDNLAAAKAEIERGMEAFTELGRGQSARFEDDIHGSGDGVAGLAELERDLEQRLEDDLQRADAQRSGRVEQLDLQVAQTKRELAGLEESLQIVAPFAGRVVYRAPSPQLMAAEAPLLVLAPRGELRLRLRLPVREATLLRDSEEIALKLVPLSDGDDGPEQTFVEKRFAGRLASVSDLPHDPGHALVHVACRPPDEAVQALAAGQQVAAELTTWAPLYGHPAFLAGLLLIAAGAAPRCSRWPDGAGRIPTGAARTPRRCRRSSGARARCSG